MSVVCVPDDTGHARLRVRSLVPFAQASQLNILTSVSHYIVGWNPLASDLSSLAVGGGSPAVKRFVRPMHSCGTSHAG